MVRKPLSFFLVVTVAVRATTVIFYLALVSFKSPKCIATVGET